MPSLQRFVIPIVILTSPAVLPGQPREPDWTIPIDYSTALRLAVEHDPRLDHQAALKEAAGGQIEQAGLRPNPVVGAEFENFLGTGPFREIRGTEVTLGVRQVIETADKRGRRTELARREREAIQWKREILLAEIESEVRGAFVAVLIARDTVALRLDQLTLAVRSESETERLVEAARAPQAELARARLATRQRQFALGQAKRDHAAAKKALAALWGAAPSPDFKVEGEIVLESSLLEFGELIARLPDTAELGQFEVIRQTREAALELEQARAKPDFELFGGARYFNQADGDIGFVVGFEVPWPLFDKNQGNIRSARARIRSVQHERESARRAMFVRLSKAHQSLANAHADAMAVKTDLLPSAEAGLADTEAGYERGQYTQLAVLQSRQTLFEVRETYLDALTRYAQAKAQILALTRPAEPNP